jgi:hypothetical protein
VRLGLTAFFMISGFNGKHECGKLGSVCRNFSAALPRSAWKRGFVDLGKLGPYYQLILSPTVPLTL